MAGGGQLKPAVPAPVSGPDVERYLEQIKVAKGKTWSGRGDAGGYPPIAVQG